MDLTYRAAALDAHGTFRSPSEWSSLLDTAGFEVLSSGSMFGAASPQLYYVARPSAEPDAPAQAAA